MNKRKPEVNEMKNLLSSSGKNLALVIGNGINRFPEDNGENSWNSLLKQLADKHLPEPLREVPPSISLTEFYDLIDLKSGSDVTPGQMQQEVCEMVSNWKPLEHHRTIVEWAKSHKTPILTTNYDRVLAEAGKCTLQRSKRGEFTAFYPWESYYGEPGTSEIDPSREFGIWHINGMEHYFQSIRLGLSHYMGSVERARSWLHKGQEESLFVGKDTRGWKGATSWLHAFFNNDILIFGLGLESQEVFLRWLFIERARYFRRFRKRKRLAWYVNVGPIDAGKKYFLNGIGIEVLEVENRQEIYGSQTWS